MATKNAAKLNPLSLSLRLADYAEKKTPEHFYQVAIVGSGVAGLAVASNLLLQDPSLNIVLIDPSDTHFYQPGWTMVGGGIFSAKSTARPMKSVIPRGAKWVKAAVKGFNPLSNSITLKDRKPIRYEILIVCPGIKLNWDAIEGLTETIGKNSVTSNYLYDLAPYTWELVSNLQKGKAIFTQPPKPIKCSVAPQKAMYLSAEYWLKQRRLNKLSIDFYHAEPVLSGVNANIPSFVEQVKKYGINIHLNQKLTRINGAAKLAWFTTNDDEGKESLIETKFDMIHIVPPQQAPDFIRSSVLVDVNGWVDVNQDTLQHKYYPNIYALGDVINSPNTKTAVAARKQASVVATNALFQLQRRSQRAEYDGFGSRPLTIKNGIIELAEFGYADNCYLDFLDGSSNINYSCI